VADGAIRRRLDLDIEEAAANPDPAWPDTLTLFLVGGAAIELSGATADPSYAQFEERQWIKSQRLLYASDKHAYAATAAAKAAPTSLGDALALAALARNIASLPGDDPVRPGYIQMERDIASTLVAKQGPDGLWRESLNDANSPIDVAASSVALYALALAVNRHHIDGLIYAPSCERAWRALVSRIQPNGSVLLDATQKDAASPAFTSGFFLLAAGEVDYLSQRKHW